MPTAQALPCQAASIPTSIPPGVVRIIRLAREGTLRRGELVATRRLGVCEVVYIESVRDLTVRALVDDSVHRLSVDFGAHVRLNDA